MIDINNFKKFYNINDNKEIDISLQNIINTIVDKNNNCLENLYNTITNDSIIKNIDNSIDIDELEEQQFNFLDYYEEQQNLQKSIKINTESCNYNFSKSKVNELDNLPTKLESLLNDNELFNFNKYGVQNENSLYHSILHILDENFCFKTKEDQNKTINDIKKNILIDLSENNLYKLFKFSKLKIKHEDIMKELNSNQNNIISVILLEKFLNKNILIYDIITDSFLERPFELSLDFCIILKFHKHYEPVIHKDNSLLNFNKDDKFFKSINFINNKLNSTANINILNSSKKVTKSMISKLNIEDLINLCKQKNIVTTHIVNTKIKNRPKKDLLEEVYLKISNEE